MTTDEIIVVLGGLAFGLAAAVYACWSRARLERQNREHPAE